MVLARCLTESDDIADALRRYEATRLDRTSRIAKASLANVSHLHNPQLADPVQAQAFMERESAAGAQFDWIYEYDATTVAVFGRQQFAARASLPGTDQHITREQ